MTIWLNDLSLIKATNALGTPCPKPSPKLLILANLSVCVIFYLLPSWASSRDGRGEKRMSRALTGRWLRSGNVGQGPPQPSLSTGDPTLRDRPTSTHPPAPQWPGPDRRLRKIARAKPAQCTGSITHHDPCVRTVTPTQYAHPALSRLLGSHRLLRLLPWMSRCPSANLGSSTLVGYKLVLWCFILTT